MTVFRILAPALIGAALFLAAGTTGADEPAEQPAVPTPSPVPAMADFSGVWNLDPKASDDLQELATRLAALRPAGGQPGPRGPGSGAPGNGAPGSGPGGGPGGAPGGSGAPGGGAMGGRMPADELGSPQEGQVGSPGGGGPGAALARAAQQLLISADGQAIEIVDGAERAESWVADGEARAQEGPGGQHTMRRAAWQKGVLVLEQLGGPLAITRHLRLTADGRRLLVDLSVPGADGRPVTAHLEYTGVN